MQSDAFPSKYGKTICRKCGEKIHLQGTSFAAHGRVIERWIIMNADKRDSLHLCEPKVKTFSKEEMQAMYPSRPAKGGV